MPEYQFGIKTLAEQLGEEKVGQPIEDEHYFPDGRTSLQQTTKGVFIYSSQGNQAGFIPFLLPS